MEYLDGLGSKGIGTYSVTSDLTARSTRGRLRARRERERPPLPPLLSYRPPIPWPELRALNLAPDLHDQVVGLLELAMSRQRETSASIVRTACLELPTVYRSIAEPALERLAGRIAP